MPACNGSVWMLPPAATLNGHSKLCNTEISTSAAVACPGSRAYKPVLVDSTNMTSLVEGELMCVNLMPVEFGA